MHTLDNLYKRLLTLQTIRSLLIPDYPVQYAISDSTYVGACDDMRALVGGCACVGACECVGVRVYINIFPLQLLYGVCNLYVY